MKKFLVAIFAFVYISTSTGATISLHYCMNQLADSDLGRQSSKTCPKCGMEKSQKENNDCCRNESKFFTSQTDQEVSVPVSHLKHLVSVPFLVSFFEMPSYDVFIIPEENLISHNPPKGNGVAVYIRNCVFRI